MKQKHPTDLLYNDAQLEVAKFFSCNSKGSPQLLLLLVVLVIRKEQLKRFWRALQNTSSQGCNYSEGNCRKCRYANTTHKTLKIHERPHISAKVFLDFLFHVILFSMFSPNKQKKKFLCSDPDSSRFPSLPFSCLLQLLCLSETSVTQI